MKVKFECEKCGKEIGSATLDIVDDDILRAAGWKRSMTATCPNCAKLRYGPLTEEMVAEALLACGMGAIARGEVGGVPSRGYKDEARFVLRLLNELDKPDGVLDARDWLLDLARET